jgi:hypothetical protein
LFYLISQEETPDVGWDDHRLLPIHWSGHIRTASYHDLFVAYRRAARAYGQEGAFLITVAAAAGDVSASSPLPCDEDSSFLFLTGCGDERLPQLPLLIFDVATYASLGPFDDGFSASGGVIRWVLEARHRGKSVEMAQWSSLYTKAPFDVTATPLFHKTLLVYAEGVASSFLASCAHLCTVQTPSGGRVKWLRNAAGKTDSRSSSSSSNSSSALQETHVPYPFLKSPRMTVEMLRDGEQQDVDRLWLQHALFRDVVENEAAVLPRAEQPPNATMTPSALQDDAQQRIARGLRRLPYLSFVHTVPSLVTVHLSQKLRAEATRFGWIRWSRFVPLYFCVVPFLFPFDDVCFWCGFVVFCSVLAVNDDDDVACISPALPSRNPTIQARSKWPPSSASTTMLIFWTR